MSGEPHYRRVILFVVILLFTTTLYFPSKLNAYEVQFSAKPKRCIKPRGEELCISNIELQWQSNTKDSYCIYSQDGPEFLQCWDNRNHGKANIEFRSATSITYFLKLKEGKKVVSTVQISVVYSLKRANRKSGRRRLWRAF